jgi:hypothetical protein
MQAERTPPPAEPSGLRSPLAPLARLLLLLAEQVRLERGEGGPIPPTTPPGTAAQGRQAAAPRTA